MAGRREVKKRGVPGYMSIFTGKQRSHGAKEPFMDRYSKGCGVNLKFSQTVIRKLEEVIPAHRLLTDPADLLCYSYDASGMEGLPMAAVFPADTGQVAAIVSFASRTGIPLFPRGAGSGTTGGSVPCGNGIVISMTAMNRIININPGNLSATVEPGVITGDLQKAVSEYNLFYPPDPASLSFCTIGGNVNTGAGGARAVKYGVTRDYVTALEVVLPSGDIIRTGPETAKGVAGYDLTRLMVGSEGTLGIVTEITLRLIPEPEATGTALVFFQSAAQACCAVRSFFQKG
jgi:glycolate oxidase